MANVETGLRTPSGDVVVVKRESVSGDQERISFAYNMVVNSAGSQFGGNESHYNWAVLDEHPWVGYTVKQFKYSEEPVSDIETIKEYLKFMTGSDFVPEYNATEPHDEFVYISWADANDDERVWKYQYVQGYGLLAFLVTQFPFALQSQISDLQNSINGLGISVSEINTRMTKSSAGLYSPDSLSGWTAVLDVDFNLDGNKPTGIFDLIIYGEVETAEGVFSGYIGRTEMYVRLPSVPNISMEHTTVLFGALKISGGALISPENATISYDQSTNDLTVTLPSGLSSYASEPSSVNYVVKPITE